MSEQDKLNPSMSERLVLWYRSMNTTCAEHPLTVGKSWRKASCPVCHPEGLIRVGSAEGKMPSREACEPLIAVLQKRLEADRG